MSRPTQANVARNDISSYVTQAPSNRANYDLLSGSYNEVEQGMDARLPDHQPAWTMDSAYHEQGSLAPLRATGHAQRQGHPDVRPSSKGRMWDPVKDCRHSNTLQEELPNFLPAGYDGSEASRNLNTNVIASTDRRSQIGHPYSHAQDGKRQEFVCSETKIPAWMGMSPCPQSNLMVSEQRSASMGSPPFQVSHLCNRTAAQAYQIESPKLAIHRSPQHHFDHRNGSSLPAHHRELSEQNENQSWESITRGAPSMAIQPREESFLHGISRGNSRRLADNSPRRSASMASDKSCPQSLAFMSQALAMARAAEKLDQQSNFKEAVRAYEQACTLFQEVIIRSGSFEERKKCDQARKAYQARVDRLSRNPASDPLILQTEKESKREDDRLEGEKPQYSLLEDLALCRKTDENLSWEEIAAMPLFKGKRKHRSLSQRKHTITRMGPSYREPERPWTEEEDKILCAMGDAGKSLGDIHRKFRSRNAERCLNRYFELKDYPPAGRNEPSASHQARQAPAVHPSNVHSAYPPNVVPVVDPYSPNHSIPSLFAHGRPTFSMPSSSSFCVGAEATTHSAIPTSSNSRAFSGQFGPPSQYPSMMPSRQQRPSAPSWSSPHPIDQRSTPYISYNAPYISNNNPYISNETPYIIYSTSVSPRSNPQRE